MFPLVSFQADDLTLRLEILQRFLAPTPAWHLWVLSPSLLPRFPPGYPVVKAGHCPSPSAPEGGQGARLLPRDTLLPPSPHPSGGVFQKLTPSSLGVSS